MPRIALFAKRHIEAGEELTFDYNASSPELASPRHAIASPPLVLTPQPSTTSQSLFDASVLENPSHELPLALMADDDDVITPSIQPDIPEVFPPDNCRSLMSNNSENPGLLVSTLENSHLPASPKRESPEPSPTLDCPPLPEANQSSTPKRDKPVPAPHPRSIDAVGLSFTEQNTPTSSENSHLHPTRRPQLCLCGASTCRKYLF